MTKGLIETEFIILFTTLFLFLLVVIAIQSETLQSLNYQQQIHQAETALRSIETIAAQAYLQGIGSVQQVRITLPKGITGATVTNASIGYTVENESVVVASNVPMNGSLPTKPGTFLVTVEAKNEYVQVS